MSRSFRPYRSADPFFRRLLKNPQTKILYSEERAKSEIAMAVRAARLRSRLTQAALAKRIGSTQAVIARLESGTDSRTPSVPLLAHIAAACNGTLELGFRFKHAA